MLARKICRQLSISEVGLAGFSLYPKRRQTMKGSR